MFSYCQSFGCDNAFVTNYEEFMRLDSLPVQMKFDGDGSTLMQ